MPAEDELRVCPAELVTHAVHVEAVAATVGTARQAGEVVRLDAEAYGKLCWVVPASLDGLQNTIITGIDRRGTSADQS